VLGKKKHMSEFSYKQYFFLQSTQIKDTIEQSALRKKRMEEKKARKAGKIYPAGSKQLTEITAMIRSNFHTR